MHVFEYSLPLTVPLSLPGQAPLTVRKGLLLHDPETGGWGDACPLPGFSQETFQDIQQAVTSKDLSSTPLPSLRFALGCTQKKWEPPGRDIPCNGLWILQSESVEDVYRRTKNWPNLVLKVKPGKVPDLPALQELIHLRPDVRFRVDGNRQWTVDQTLNLFEALPQERLAYMEEPLGEPEGYERLWRRAEVPIALDESLLRPEGADLATSDHVVALVLKPTLLGGESDWRNWTRLSREKGKACVWSSCFESGVGLWHLAKYAEDETAVGLDTGTCFGNDLVQPRPLVREGVIPKVGQLEVSSAFLHS